MVDSLFNGVPIELDSLHIYKQYRQETLSEDSPQERQEWLEAPVIVRTNRERLTTNYIRAIQYATETGRMLIRWPSSYSNWEGKPTCENDVESTIESDAAFWEFFVESAPCYLTDTINKERGLCNGTRGKFHSLVLTSEQQEMLRIANRANQTIITLSSPPIGINIAIMAEVKPNTKRSKKKRKAKQNRTKRQSVTIIPIKRGCRYNREKPMFVSTPNILVNP